MEVHRLANNYLLFSIISLFMVPITGIVALSYAVSAKLAIRSNEDIKYIEKLLEKSYRWLKLTVVVFAVFVPLLILFFFLLPRFS